MFIGVVLDPTVDEGISVPMGMFATVAEAQRFVENHVNNDGDAADEDTYSWISWGSGDEWVRSFWTTENDGKIMHPWGRVYGMIEVGRQFTVTDMA